LVPPMSISAFLPTGVMISARAVCVGIGDGSATGVISGGGIALFAAHPVTINAVTANSMHTILPFT